MKFTIATSAIALLAGSALASPAPAATLTTAPTPTPPSSCETYTTTTSYHYEMCPMYCVTPDSPLCPKYPCPALPTGACPSGQTITRLPQLPATTIVSTVTGTAPACTVTVEADVGCAVCGCLGCEVCAKEAA